MIISGVMKHECSYKELDIGEIFSFSDDRERIWNKLHASKYDSVEEEYEGEADEEIAEHEKRIQDYLGEDLFMVCWENAESDVDTEYAFHPKYISLKNGCIHDIIEEQRFFEHNYYSDVRVYDTCRETDIDFDDDSESWQ